MTTARHSASLELPAGCCGARPAVPLGNSPRLGRNYPRRPRARRQRVGKEDRAPGMDRSIGGLPCLHHLPSTRATSSASGSRPAVSHRPSSRHQPSLAAAKADRQCVRCRTAQRLLGRCRPRRPRARRPAGPQRPLARRARQDASSPRALAPPVSRSRRCHHLQRSEDRLHQQTVHFGVAGGPWCGLQRRAIDAQSVHLRPTSAGTRGAPAAATKLDDTARTGGLRATRPQLAENRPGRRRTGWSPPIELTHEGPNGRLPS